MTRLLALFTRFLREQARARTTYIVRASICFVLLLILWGTHESAKWTGAPGRSFFGSLLVLDFILVCLAGIGVCTAVVAQEKEDGTMGLLRLADLSPVSILFGKGGGAILTVLLVLAVQIPFSLMAVTMGGIGSAQIFRAYALLAAFLCGLGGVGLLFSTVCNRVVQASLAMLLLFFGAWFVPTFLQAWAAHLIQLPQSEHYLAVASRIASVGEFLDSIQPARCLSQLAGNGYRAVDLPVVIGSYLAIGLAGFLLAWAIFERRCGSEQTYGEARLSSRSKAFWRRWIGRPSARAALVWRTYHFQFGGFVRAAAIIVLGLTIVGATAEYASQHPRGYDSPRDAAIIASYIYAWTASLICLLLVAATAWSGERWGRHLSALLTTPQPLGVMHLDKFCAGLLALLPALGFFVLGAFLSLGKVGISYASSPDLRFRDILPWLMVALEGIYAISLTLNFSLRIKWMAVPAAVGTFWVSNFVASIVIGIMFRGFNSESGFFSLATTFLVIASGVLLRDVHRQLQHHAASEG